MYPRRMVGSLMRAAAVALLLVAWNAREARAQRIDGQVVDAQTATPIAGVSLQLVDEQGQAVRTAVSNARGYFTLQARTAGIYRIHASRVGYTQALSDPMDLVSSRERDVTVRLSSEAVQLEPVTVTGVPQSARLAATGFYNRRERYGPNGLRMAHFLEQHDIERLNPFHVSDIFNHLPGVWNRGGRPVMRRGCTPAIVIDGFVVASGRSRVSRTSILPVRADLPRELASARSLAGVEVYYDLAIPERYLLDAGGCGVIIYWTK